MKIRKIPLEQFIQILSDIYDGGTEYIDIVADKSNEEGSSTDVMRIVIKPEYTNVIEEEEEDEDISTSFSEEDINKLI
jgi:hypothetical protein